MAHNEFRADLYYRISVIPVLVPALRDRRSDIPLLAGEFLERFNKENSRDLHFARDAVEVLMGCGFPGNVRELENCVQRTATLAQGETILGNDFACRHNECLSSLLWRSQPDLDPRPPVDIPLPIVAPPDRTHQEAAQPVNGGAVVRLPSSMPMPSPVSPAVATGLPPDGELGERERLVDAMERAGWVQAKAARLLGLTPRQIGYALKKYDIEIKRF